MRSSPAIRCITFDRQREAGILSPLLPRAGSWRHPDQRRLRTGVHVARIRARPRRLVHASRETFGSRARGRRVYESWADEDVYVPLADKIRLLERAGFAVDVPWRRSPFAVIVAARQE
jgi:hypothetical protein